MGKKNAEYKKSNIEGDMGAGGPGAGEVGGAIWAGGAGTLGSCWAS